MNKMIIQFGVMLSVGALIGWFTNYLAIKLLFRPYKEINILGFKLQGLIPKRRNEISQNIAEVIENELISISDLVEKLKKSDMNEEIVDRLIDKILSDKLKKSILDKNTLLKMFLTDSILDKIKKYFRNAILENKEEIIEEAVKLMEEKIDFKHIMLEKMTNFSLKEIEDIILKVSKNELKHIEIIGGVLGGIIAILQFFIMNLFSIGF